EWYPQLELPLLATLEDAKHVAGLTDLEARQRIEEGHDALVERLLGRGRRDRVESPGPALFVVALSESRQLARKRAVVVERGSPPHRAGRHHALPNDRDLRGVAAGLAAALPGGAQIAGVHEADVLDGFEIQRGIAALGVGRRLPQVVHAWLHVGLPLDGVVGRRAGGRGSRLDHVTPAAVTVDAGRLHGRGLVHGRRVGLRVAAHAAGILPIDVELALPAEIGAESLGRFGLWPGRRRRLGRRLGGLFLLRRSATDSLSELDATLSGGCGSRPGA